MSQFDRMSPEFRDSLRNAVDKIRTAQAEPSAPAPSSADAKENSILAVLDKMRKFQERSCKEWLYSLSDEEVQEVGRFFDELNNLSIVDIFALMREQGHGSPFGILGHMFSSEACGAQGVEVVDDTPPDNAEGISPALAN